MVDDLPVNPTSPTPGASIEVAPVVLVRELWSGDAAVAPVTYPALSTVGDLDAALGTQRAFLREMLARSSPEVLARMCLPATCALREVAVLVRAEDDPRRPREGIAVTVPCVTVPAPAGTWVFAPTVGHTFFVGEGEPLDDALRAEVRRIVVAQDRGPNALAALLPARAHRLERLALDVARLDVGEVARGASIRKTIAAREARRRAREVLCSVGALMAPAKLPPCIGREREASLLTSLLGGASRISVILSGEALVGKTALLEAWLAAEDAAGREPCIVSTSAAEIIGSAAGEGPVDDKVAEVMAAAAAIDAILYFENVEDLLAERVGSGFDILAVIKPYLDDGKVRLVAEASGSVLDRLEARNQGFFASFSRVRVEPLSAAEALQALVARAAHDRKTSPHRAQVDVAVLPRIVELTERYLPSVALPGKAVRLYDELRAQRELDTTSSGDVVTHRAADLYELFAVQTGIPAFLLHADRALAVDDVERALATQIVGQRAAVRRVAETVAVVKAGLQPPGRPLATFLFVGPTGVGKTELARALARYLFGTAERMIRFDMSEFGDRLAADRLIRGTDLEDGLLTRAIRQQPFAVVLLDEIEKAHSAVFDLLLQVLGEGRLSDARGRLAYFHNAIVLMTSNLGASDQGRGAGFAAAAPRAQDRYEKHVNATFRPELVNRIDRIVAFAPLTPEEARKVAALAIERLRSRRGLEEAGVSLVVADAAVDALVAAGYSEQYGARALRRHLDAALVDPLARMLARLGVEGRDLDVVVTVKLETPPDPGALATHDGHGVRIVARRRSSTRAARELVASTAIADLRREVDGWLELPRVEELREQISHLVVQLARTATATERQPSRAAAMDRRAQRDAAELFAEHQRLAAIWDRASTPQADLHAAEELALSALFAGEPIGGLAAQVREAHARVRGALPYLLVALERRRDEVTLLVQELDDGRGLELWLGGLLRTAPTRDWRVTVHVDGGERLATDEWPASRRWGPPREPERILESLWSDARTYRSVVVRCWGAFAGVFLALEAGLHKVTRPRATRGERGERAEPFERALLLVRVLGLKAAITDSEWSHPSLAPLPPPRAAELGRGPAARDLDARTGKLVVGVGAARRTLAIDADQYFARLDDIVLEHLLVFETDDALDRDDVYPPVEG